MSSKLQNPVPELGRTALLLLDSKPFIRGPGKALYGLLAKLSVALLRSLPEVSAVYLVGSMASEDIAPGLSDIDMVVVIEDLSNDKELQFIQQIERRLRFAMPPFGQSKSGTHLMIYSRSEWRLFGELLLGKKAGGPKIVFSEPGLSVPNRVDGRVRSLHHLFKAFWRLQTLQDQMQFASDKRITALLRLRMCDRLLKALENACMESEVTPESRQALHNQVTDVQRELNLVQADQNDTGLAGLLPQLLCAVDQAIACCRPVGKLPSDSSHWSVTTEAQACSNFAHSLALAADLSSAVAKELDGISIYVTRLKALDLVVLEPMSAESIRIVHRCYIRTVDRNVRIVSRRMLATFYLNDKFGPLAFIRLQGNLPILAKGSLSTERFLLEAYAMYPRIRALSRLKNRGSSEAYVPTLRRLIEFAKGENQPSSQSDISINSTYSVPSSGARLVSNFNRLRQMADQLTLAIALNIKTDRS